MNEETRAGVDETQILVDVREGHRFDVAALERYVAPRVPGFTRPVQVRQFLGGQSNPTYHLTAGDRQYVLRRKPPGPLLPSAHAVDREYRVIAALHPVGFPVAIIIENINRAGNQPETDDPLRKNNNQTPVVEDSRKKSRNENEGILRPICSYCLSRSTWTTGIQCSALLPSMHGKHARLQSTP